MSSAPGLLQYFPGTNTPVQYPDLNSIYGNPDVPSSPLYAGGSGGQSILALPSTENSSSIPTFSTTVYAQSPTSSDGLPDPLLSLNLPNILPSAETIQEQMASGQSTDNGPLGTGVGTAAQQNAPGVNAAALNTPVSGPAWLTSLLGGFSWGRVGAFVLALILIAAGLYLFGSQSQTVRSAVRTGGRLALA
jgi:hypothetical protein